MTQAVEMGATGRFRSSQKRLGVLLLGDFTADTAHQAERLRSGAIPVWTAGTDFEVHWLLQRASVRASVTLVDLRQVESYRDDEVRRFASLASSALLPTILVGASDAESRLFRDVVAKLPAGATDDDVARAIVAMHR